MESYKPLVTQKGLKRLCKRAVAKHDTPLSQAREVVQEIGRLRRSKLVEYKGDEWMDEPENRPYVQIARDYQNRQLARIKAKKKKRLKEND